MVGRVVGFEYDCVIMITVDKVPENVICDLLVGLLVGTLGVVVGCE